MRRTAGAGEFLAATPRRDYIWIRSSFSLDTTVYHRNDVTYLVRDNSPSPGWLHLNVFEICVGIFTLMWFAAVEYFNGIRNQGRASENFEKSKLFNPGKVAIIWAKDKEQRTEYVWTIISHRRNDDRNECLSNNNYHLMPVVCYQHHHHNGQGGQCSNNITITRALAAVYQGIRLLYWWWVLAICHTNHIGLINQSIHGPIIDNMHLQNYWLGLRWKIGLK